MSARKSTLAMKVKVSPTGRLSLPIEVRRAIGVERGGTVMVEAKDGHVRIRTVDEIFDRTRESAQALLGANASVGDFLKFRRRQWSD